MEKKAFSIALAFLMSITAFSSTPAYCQETPTVELASGGPFKARSHNVERFSATFKLTADDTKRPLSIILYNGFGPTPGFNWLRVFLGGDINVSNLGHFDEPTGDLLFDENYLQRHVITLDVTDVAQPGINTLFIEGSGPKGATINWALQGAMDPIVMPLNPTVVIPGSRLLLHGKGFSTDPDENQVTIDGQSCQVLSATRSSLVVRVPQNLSGDKVRVVITTNGLEGDPFTLSVQQQ